MTKKEGQKLIDFYIEWMKNDFSVDSFGKFCQITTPFFDKNNDRLKIYVAKKDNKIILSDDGYIFYYLATEGSETKFPKRKRKAMLKSMLKGLGLHIEGEEILMEFSPCELGKRVHAFIQVMLDVRWM